MGGVRLSFRLDEELADVLRELAGRANLDRSSTLRELIRQAGARSELWPPPMLTEAELVALLEERARAGSVTATITLLRRVDSQPDRDPEPSALDELDGGRSMVEILAERAQRQRRNGRQEDPDV